MCDMYVSASVCATAHICGSGQFGDGFLSALQKQSLALVLCTASPPTEVLFPSHSCLTSHILSWLHPSHLFDCNNLIIPLVKGI